MARATYFCVDIECSGPAPALFDMLSIGVVAVHEADDLRLGASTYLELQPTGAGVDAGAMAVNGLDLAALTRDGLPRRAALQALAAFVVTHTDAGTTPVFVGHNAPFDWSFINYAYHAEALANPFGYKALDTKALAVGVTGEHWLTLDKERLAALIPLPPVEPAKVHRADYDAWYQAHILVGLLTYAGA